MNNLAQWIARKIFEHGDEPNSPCHRIQFKGGEWPDNERNQGGLGEEPLTDVIQQALDEYTLWLSKIKSNKP